MRRMATCLLFLAPIAAISASGRQMIVACAPGYPGTTAQAQPTMDDFARAVAGAGGWNNELGAVYYEQLEPGLARLSETDAAVALVPLPFYLEFREQLELSPLLHAVPAAGPREIWSLVVRRGSLASSSALSGWQLRGNPGYSSRFVRRVALADWGRTPDDLHIEFDSKLLASLRRAAQGERVSVLLDRSQADALGSLPFAEKLEVVARSSPLPSSLICEVGGRMSESDVARLRSALLGLDGSESGRKVLAALRLARFEAVSNELQDLQRAFGAEPD